MTTPLSHGDRPIHSSLPPARAGCPAADTAGARLHHHRAVFLLACLAITLLGGQALPAQPPSGALPPTELSGLRFTNAFFPGTVYRATVPSLETLLGFPASQRAASAAEIEKCLQAWSAAAPDRTRLVEYARSHEGRPLHFMIVTAPQNMTRLEDIQRGLAKLADPRSLSEEEARQLIDTLPPVAWLAYTIHGDETEGSDAALAVLYHLLAAENSQVLQLLQNLVVIIDPLMNPDGRDRFLKMIAEQRGTMPNVDDQSLVHTGQPPRGRGNHYYFDLNRDWIFGIHPETRGRLREVARWNPVLFVDAHGMGPQDTHLFSPPREPVNIHMPPSRARWNRLFAREQARAFDQQGLVYYHGEWNEDWYPGYSDSWPAYRGAVGILYEQARIAEDGVRRPEGRILSYRESVFHHVLGSMANLTTLQAHGSELLRNFYEVRQAAADPQGAYANRTYAVLPTANRSRLKRFTQLLRLQGVELYQATTEFTAATATDPAGRTLQKKIIPAGTILIPNRQPLGYLVAALLDFDPRIPAKALEDERREILSKGQSRIYDVTSWSLTMLMALDALVLPLELPESARPFVDNPHAEPNPQVPVPSPVAFVIDGADDLSVTAAARLMERNVQVRVAAKPFRFDDREFARGSVVVTRLDNRTFSGDLRQTIESTAHELGVPSTAVGSGLGDGDLPDLGGEHFQRLEPPRIALLTRTGFNTYDAGEIWFLLDHTVGIRHSQLDASAEPDLSRYNVLIVPDRSGGSLPGTWTNRLKDWVRAGGTLIAINSSAAQLADEKSGLSKVRTLPDALGKAGDYELAVFREWLAQIGEVPPAETLWSHQIRPGLKYPWQSIGGDHPEEKELKKRDAWQKLFMPQGALVASRVNTNHWLTLGCGDMLPVLVFGNAVLMAAEGVESPVRLGYLSKAINHDIPDRQAGAADEPDPKPKAEITAAGKDLDSKEKEQQKEKKEPPRVGWSALPPGTELHLRMSGLLWPEAAHRLAHSAYVTRETYGRGQIILFATSPTFRASTVGPIRLLLNAVIYGPGFGAAQPIRP